MKCVFYGPVSGDIPSFVGVVFSKVMKFFPPKKSNQRHNFSTPPRQLLGEKRTREEVSFRRGPTVERFFFSKLLVDSSPRKTQECPLKNSAWKTMIFPFKLFWGDFCSCFGGCKITFTPPLVISGVAYRWVNMFHVHLRNLGNDDDDDDLI